MACNSSTEFEEIRVSCKIARSNPLNVEMEIEPVLLITELSQFFTIEPQRRLAVQLTHGIDRHPCTFPSQFLR
jgi:hypothetical protein